MTRKFFPRKGEPVTKQTPSVYRDDHGRFSLCRGYRFLRFLSPNESPDTAVAQLQRESAQRKSEVPS